MQPKHYIWKNKFISDLGLRLGDLKSNDIECENNELVVLKHFFKIREASIGINKTSDPSASTQQMTQT